MPQEHITDSIIGRRHVRHGQSKHPLYSAWKSMLNRCYLPNNPEYHRYGGRGIRVCERWKMSPTAFFEDIGPRPGPGYSIDRYPNNDGDYEPGNVRWATNRQQNRNMRRNRKITFNGETHCLTDWAKMLGTKPETLFARLRKGWSVEKILAEPVAPRRPRRGVLKFNDQSHNLSEWARILGISKSGLRKRLDMGWTVKRALTIPVSGKQS